MKLPAFGKTLLEVRKRGARPAFPVVVTDDWPIAYIARDRLDWFALVCDPPDRRYDLAILLDLDVMLVHAAPAERIAPMLSAARAARPRRLVQWDSLAWLTLIRETIDELDREPLPS